MNEPFISIKIDHTLLVEYKAQLTYGNFILKLVNKPNIFMRLFLKIIGIKVKILKGGIK